MKSDITIHSKKSNQPIVIQLPVSKSEYNRAAVISFLSRGKIKLKNHSNAKDSQKMNELLAMITNRSSTTLDCGLAGTTYRFLVSVASITEGEWILTGNERMKERPIGILVNSLVNLGAKIEYIEKVGFPPLKIHGSKMEGGAIKTDASISSQFVSSLMLIGPVLKNGIEIQFDTKPVSMPYIEMTSSIMKECGAEVILTEKSVKVLPKSYSEKIFESEVDWSAASYFYSMVAVDTNLKITIPGLKINSYQGDSVVQEIFSQFGVETIFRENEIEIFNNNDIYCDYFEYDFSNCPDLAQTLTFTCCALRIPGKLTGLSTLKNKETDRIVALKNEIEKCGMNVEISDDSIQFSVKNDLPKNIEINTYDDHRMAMAGSIMAFVCDSVKIEDHEVVVKSFPDFWKECSSVIDIK